MNRLRFAGLAALTCLVLLVASSLPRPATAQGDAASVVVKWEYKIIHPNPDDVNAFNELGAQGWEMCGAVGHIENFLPRATFVFKRRAR